MIAVKDEIDDADFTTAREDHLLIDSDKDLSDLDTTLVESVAARESRKRNFESKIEPSKQKKWRL